MAQADSVPTPNHAPNPDAHAPRHRGPEPALVREQYRSGSHRYPASDQTSGAALDGGYTGRPCRNHGLSLRGQVHAAVGVLGRSRG